MPTAAQLTDPVAEHAEGPVWDAAGGRLLCVDLERGDLLAVDPGSGATAKRHVAEALACLRPRARGGWALAARRRYALVDDVGALLSGDAAPRMLAPLWEDRGVRFNDGGCDPSGRFFVGSMAYDQTPGAGQMWRLDPDGSATRVMTDLTVSNGLAWTPDGERAYFVDSPTLRVDLLHVDPATGDVVGREPFTTVTDGPGVPDGLVVDAQGGVWVAVNGEGAVVRYDASGAVTERVEVPVPSVTACTLGGPDLSTLYATTSTQGVDTSAHPAAGSVFALAAGVRGVPPMPCAA